MRPSIVPIVEGQSEVASAGILLKRVWPWEIVQATFDKPWRAPLSKLVKPRGMEDEVRKVLARRKNVSGLLVIQDCDIRIGSDESEICPAKYGPLRLEQCKAATKIPVAVVLAKLEFEAWFLGSVESLGGVCGLPSNPGPIPNPENIRGAKERLSALMGRGRRYYETVDQAEMVQQMDIELARQRCPSFDKLFREVARLAEEIKKPATDETNISHFEPRG